MIVIRPYIKNIVNEVRFASITTQYTDTALKSDKEKLKTKTKEKKLTSKLKEDEEEFNVQNLVFSSSCTVYGSPKGSRVVTEETVLQDANSPYGNTKRIGERIISDFVNSKVNLKVLNLRYFNPVGAHESALIGELPAGKPNNLLPAVTQSAIGKFGPITVHGNDYSTVDGTCVRDYVHVVDVADAHVKAVEWLMEQEQSLEEHINNLVQNELNEEKSIRVI